MKQKSQFSKATLLVVAYVAAAYVQQWEVSLQEAYAKIADGTMTFGPALQESLDNTRDQLAEPSNQFLQSAVLPGMRKKSSLGDTYDDAVERVTGGEIGSYVRNILANELTLRDPWDVSSGFTDLTEDDIAKLAARERSAWTPTPEQTKIIDAIVKALKPITVPAQRKRLVNHALGTMLEVEADKPAKGEDSTPTE